MQYYCSLPGFELHIRPKGVQWIIIINGEVYGKYPSPEAAAHDVHLHATGNDAYDLASVESPAGLDGWAAYCGA